MTEQAPTKINFPLLVVVLLIIGGLFAMSFFRVRIDTDLVSTLPTGDRAISDAVYIFKHHPIKDRIAIDVGIDRVDQDLLILMGKTIENQLLESGLFESVGLDDIQNRIPDLVEHISHRFPVLFSASELEERVLPLISPTGIKKSLEKLHKDLLSLQSIGQAGFYARDPFGLRNIIIEKLAALAPGSAGTLYKGRLFSKDKKHLLVIATPKNSGTDTTAARKTAYLMANITKKVKDKYETGRLRVTLTPVGTYRAALDNETIIRKDVGKAVVFATMGIALLLVFAFPRPLIGLFALVPAIAGTMTAFVVFSLFHDTISIMVLGFGGAIISITVDHGIAYLLFMDQDRKTFGRDASKEVWAVGLLAVLTTVGAFCVLGFSGFPVFEQLGMFTALGILCAFLFVHWVFPLVFQVMPPARKNRRLWLKIAVENLTQKGAKGAWAALVLSLVLIFFAAPKFNVDLGAMNSMKKETLAADRLMTDVWGNMFNRVYLMAEGKAITGLQQTCDLIADRLEKETGAGNIEKAFSPSYFFPGNLRQQENIKAWRNFWTTERVAEVEKLMDIHGRALGFTRNAFTPFYEMIGLEKVGGTAAPIPDEFFDLLGIQKEDEAGGFRQVSSITPLNTYDADAFFSGLGSLARVFDPGLFSKKLGQLLFDTFVKMLWIIGASVALLLFIFLVDVKLTFIALLPLLFAFICTLGTMGIMGKPLDIPALMLGVVILGMGVDYSLFMVRAYQRYQDDGHPSYSMIRMAVFMASMSTLIGFGVLLTAEHNLLKSAGLTSFLGIGYCLMGSFLILPPLLKRHFETGRVTSSTQKKRENNGLWRYRNMEAYPRIFARIKLGFDPMFTELSNLLPSGLKVRTIMDIGCGFGVPATWMLDRYKGARVFGIEPLADRVRVASMVLGENNVIKCGAAPDLPDPDTKADLVFMLDMNHFLDDAAYLKTLGGIHDRMSEKGLLIQRSTITPQRRFPLVWWMENLKLKINSITPHYREPDIIKDMAIQAGFKITKTLPSGKNGELFWLVAEPDEDKR